MIYFTWRLPVVFVMIIISPFFIFAQDKVNWYIDLPQKAKIVDNGLLMEIGDKKYRIYNAFDPIAPTGGERVIDFDGALKYYMWIFSFNGSFTVARIDQNMNIYYFDTQQRLFISPQGDIFSE